MVGVGRGTETGEAGLSTPRPDEEICGFLRQLKSECPVAPLLEAGVATRDNGSWQIRWGGVGPDETPHLFDLASVTKPHFAVCVAHLVGQGLFEWTTLLQEMLPEVEGTHAGGQTVEALLSHRSGLRAHLELFRASWNGGSVRVAELLRQAADARRENALQPPFSPLYSDLGYILVGFGIEHLLGQDLDKTLKETLLSPWMLGSGSARSLRRSTKEFTKMAASTEFQPPRGGLLRGEVHDDNAWALRGSALCGHAGLFGSVLDVLAFGSHVLDGISGRNGEQEKQLLQPLLSNRPGGTLRMGFDGVSGSSSMAGTRAGRDTFGHLGFTGTSLWCDPDRARATVMLSNRVYPVRDNPKIRLVRPKIHDFLWTC